MSDVTGESLVLTLFVVAGVSLLFGLGVPTVGSYVIVAVLGAPLLTGFGVELLAAHMLILYFTMLSGLTPPGRRNGAGHIPDCGRRLFGDPPSPASPWPMPGFVIPFLFAYEPALLGFGGHHHHLVDRDGGAGRGHRLHCDHPELWPHAVPTLRARDDARSRRDALFEWTAWHLDTGGWHAHRRRGCCGCNTERLRLLHTSSGV